MVLTTCSTLTERICYDFRNMNGPMECFFAEWAVVGNVCNGQWGRGKNHSCLSLVSSFCWG